MIEDIRNRKNLMIYRDQLEEVKARLNFISAYSNPEKDIFIIELHALQIRKLIELIAFSLMAIHKDTYRVYRMMAEKDYSKDWNGRDIITSILKINPDMFFKPSEREPKINSDGSREIQLKPDFECYSLRQMAKLYDRCGGVLHVANPWNQSTKIDQFHNELPSIIKKLKNSLQDHVILVNHWDHQESTALVFSLNNSNQPPSYELAEASGNIAFSV